MAFATTPGTVVLVWNANTESDLAGYRVHYGTASAPFGSIVAVTHPTATISNLTNGYTYTFAVTAYNTAGAESPFSASLSYTVGSAQLVPTAILANISTRASVQTGDLLVLAVAQTINGTTLFNAISGWTKRGEMFWGLGVEPAARKLREALERRHPAG